MAKLLKDILAGCMRGDEHAVDELVRRFRRSAQTLAEAILKDEHLAEDAVQNSFVTAVSRLDQLRDSKSFAGWFRQIVRTEVQRISRRRKDTPIGAGNEMHASDATPDTNAQVSELRCLVRDAVKNLPPSGNETAEMFYFEQRSCSEIAELLQIPSGTVKRRLHDARKQLRSMLLGYVREDKPDKREGTSEWRLPL